MSKTTRHSSTFSKAHLMHKTFYKTKHLSCMDEKANSKSFYAVYSFIIHLLVESIGMIHTGMVGPLMRTRDD